MQIQDLQIVLKVAETQSITAAAHSLDVKVATASAAVKRVERQLGHELFYRSTRQLRLTTVGEKYIPQCEQALNLLAQARQSMQTNDDSIGGELRLSVSSDFGRNLLMPWLDDFMNRYPDISLKMNIGDSTVDFYRDAVDVALRYGSPTESHLYGFKICDVPSLLCATPAYLEQYGIPQHPHDLVGHNGLFYQLHDDVYNLWTFTDGAQTYRIKMTGNRAANDGELVRRWCVAGQGIAIKASLDIAEDLLRGNVVNVLPQYKPRMSELWLVCPSRNIITPAIRLLRDTIKERSFDILRRLHEQGFVDQSVLTK